MEQQTQNLCLNFNVHINVNVNAKTNKTNTHNNNNSNTNSITANSSDTNTNNNTNNNNANHNSNNNNRYKNKNRNTNNRENTSNKKQITKLINTTPSIPSETTTTTKTLTKTTAINRPAKTINNSKPKVNIGTIFNKSISTLFNIESTTKTDTTSNTTKGAALLQTNPFPKNCKPLQQQQQQNQQKDEATKHKHLANHQFDQTTNTMTQHIHKFRFELNSHNGISMLLIVNLLFLLFMSLCCDVCISYNDNTTTNISLDRNFAEHINQNLTVLFSNESGENEDTVIVEHITNDCKQRCINEYSLVQDEFGIKCNKTSQEEKCFHSRCIKGCVNWWRALQEFESCQEACTSTKFFPYDLACIASCESSQRHYWHFQRMAFEDYIHTYPPILIADSLTAHSMSLRWPVSIPEHLLSNRPFHIQYQIMPNGSEAPGSRGVEEKWLYLTNYNCNDLFECDLLDSLTPYTSYRFRFELPIGEHMEDFLYSPPSKIYTTLAYGEPASEVIIDTLIPIDHKHIFVSWRPGSFLNGPLAGFKLKVNSMNNRTVYEKVLSAESRSLFVGFLKPSTNYTLSMALMNDNGEGPWTDRLVATKHLPQSNIDMEKVNVLLADDKTIRLKPLEPLTESQVVFETDKQLRDYDLDILNQRLFVIDGEGEITSLIMGHQEGQYAFNLKNSYPEMKPLKLSVDYLNQRLFIAGKLSNGEMWSLVTTDYAGGNLQVLATKILNSIDVLQVDMMNGWLFMLCSELAVLMKLNLSTKFLTTVKLSNFAVRSFTNDYERFMLLAQSHHDSELYEVSYDGLYRESLSLSNGSLVSISNMAKRLLPGFWPSFSHFSNVILATNGSHLMHFNYESNDYEVLYLRDVDWCWKLIPIQQLNYQIKTSHNQGQVRPFPKPNGAPEKLQVLLTGTIAKISWSPPVLYEKEQLQTAGAWKDWEYELEILDVASNSAFQIRNIRTSFFTVEKLQPQSVYRIRVKASSRFGFVESEWSSEVTTRTWPLAEHHLLWTTMAGHVYESNEMGENLKILNYLSHQIRDFLQVNGTLFYITEKGNQLKCENLRNPEVMCSFKAENVRDMAYDWRAGKLYWIDFFRNCLMRSDLMGLKLEILPTFGATSIQIDSLNGFLYYSTATRLLRRPLSGSQGFEETVFYHANGLNEKILGFTLDLKQQELYCLVSDHDGTLVLMKISLFEGPLATPTSQAFGDDINPKSLQFINEINSLMWLSKDGKRVGLGRWKALEHVDWMQFERENETFTAVHLMTDFTPYPDEMIVPEAVAPSSVYIDVGYWDDFNVRWEPVSNVENYSIFYSVVYSHDSIVKAVEALEPVINLNDLEKAQSKLTISITAHSYWSRGPTTTVELITPAAAPTQPKRLRVFLQREDLPLANETKYKALLRWDPPEKATGLNSGSGVTGYKVFCWLGSESFGEKEVESTGPLEVLFDNLTLGATYTFQVQTMTMARFATSGEKSAVHSIQIGQGSPVRPLVLYSTSEFIAYYDLDLGKSSIIVYTPSEVDHLAMIQGEHRLIWVNDNVELMSFVPGAASPIKLARMRAEVLALTVDWISRIVYWAEMNTSREEVDIYHLDLCDFEGKVMQGIRLFSLPKHHFIKDLIVLPFSRVLMWLEHSKGEKACQLQARRLKDFRPLKLKKENWYRLFEASFTSELETINLVDMKGRMCVFDLQRQLCMPQKMHFGVSNDYQTEISRDPGFFYVLKNETLRAFSRKKHSVEYMKHLPGARKIKAFNVQEYPKTECLWSDLNSKEESSEDLSQLLQPDIEEVEETFITIELPNLNSNKPECGLPMPGTVYHLNFTDNSNSSKILKTHFPLLNLTDLEPFTSYSFQFNISTFYQQKLEKPVWISQRFEIKTAETTPELPEHFEAVPISPNEIRVSWKPSPIKNFEAIHYELHWHLLNTSHSSQKLLNETKLHLINLEPDSSYEIFLRVFSLPHKSQTTKSLVVNTFKEPNPLQMYVQGAYNLSLIWEPNAEFHSVILVCRAVNGLDSFSLDMTDNQTFMEVTGLEPKTRYEFFLELQYAPKAAAYQWPEFPKDHFIFETAGDKPSSPGRPQIEFITGEIFKVFWEPADGHGSPILEYNMEALQARKRYRRHLPKKNETVDSNNNNSSSLLLSSSLPWLEEPKPLEDKWIKYCNTTELSCLVRDLHSRRLLMFRVRARNDPYGWGPYSSESDYVAEPFVTPEKRNTLIWAILAPASIVSSFVIFMFILKQLQNRRTRNKKRLLEKSRPSIWSTMSSNQQQMMLARNRGLSIVSNSTSFGGGAGLNAFGPLSDADIALLPQIKWNQISLLNFLGSGAFGEVYEGLVHYNDERQPEKVAIKSLRKGCSEFSELLQEAQLMSHFKHENIVRLVGICIDSESISIIMEHMEGGDLLTFLRESRASSLKRLASLQLLDMITMCIDVATGCSYLEDMHFVHRDLACRNCLVSSRNPTQRVVKIGDFGLARDIYKHDYYRKEGEGLLPVRWMAPESLMDGIFTSQSDIWAFGVLCWEILTLGQQPYAARSNLEVLNFVKNGGRLQQPDNCPDKLFSLLEDCWHTDPDERPSFRKCVNTLIAIKIDVRRVNMGYKLDDADDIDNAMYANSNGILLSNFLATPLPKVDEDPEYAIGSQQTEHQHWVESGGARESYDFREIQEDSSVDDDVYCSPMAVISPKNFSSGILEEVEEHEGFSRL